MTMSLSDLCQGDVLLFEGMKNDAISFAIMFLTDSSVSHAAMLYSEETDQKPATLVHEASPKIPVSIMEAAGSFGDRQITIRRLTKEPTYGSQPLIDAADRYLLEKAPYNNNGLYLVGILLIYKKVAPDTVTSRIIAQILKLAAKLLTQYLNSKRFPAQHPMTCSQFVAQCYDDAGSDYRLFEHGLLARNMDSAASPPDEQPTLLEQAIDVFDQAIDLSASLDTANEEALGEQEIIARAGTLSEELVNNLQRLQTMDMAPADAQPLDNELSLAIGEFAERLYQLYQEDDDRSTPINGTLARMQWLRDQRNLFVSPADLLHCDRLTTAGTVRLQKK